MSDLSSTQRESVVSLMEIAGITNEELAISLLDSVEWSLPIAISNYMEMHADDIPPPPAASATNSSTYHPTSSRPGGYAPLPSDSDNRSSADRSEDNDRTAEDDSSYSTQRMGSSYTNGNEELFVRLLTPFSRLFQMSTKPLQPTVDAQQFNDRFNQSYGEENHAPWFQGSYKAALESAYTDSRLLIVYLHSSLHGDTDLFCQQLLCSETFSRIASQRAVMWGGDISTPEAFALSSHLQASTFPFLAVLSCKSNRVVELVDRVEGWNPDVNSTIQRLEQNVENLTAALDAARREQERRTEAQRLREQQDREYRESLEEEQRIAAQRAAAEAERIAQEEAAAIAAAEQAERERQAANERIEVGAQLRIFLQDYPEPVPGPTVAALRFMLPREEGDITRNFSINTNYPKATVTDLSMTIEGFGLFPRGALYIQDLDA